MASGFRHRAPIRAFIRLNEPRLRFTTLAAAALLLAALAACFAGCGRAPSPAAGSAGALPDSVASPRGFAAPADSLVPKGALGESIRRGRAIMLATRDSLPGHVGNRLACTNCHRDAGTRAASSSWVGSFASFPQYNARAGRVITIEDRVNECLRRSLNGTPLESNGRDMIDMVAYLAFLSNGQPHGRRAPWLGYRQLVPRPADAAAGERVFMDQCARCHGAAGQSIAGVPPVWGPDSYAIGAGMSRLRTAAAFIRWNMPFDRPGTLTDQQAFDVAAFVLKHPRPDTPGKEYDWPNGDPPADAAYATLGRKTPVARGR